MTEIVDGQVSMLDLGIWSGRTSQEHSAATEERTSVPSSKKQRTSQTKVPLFLSLQKVNGQPPAQSWETDGASLGEFSTRSFGESPSVAVASSLSQILENGKLKTGSAWVIPEAMHEQLKQDVVLLNHGKDSKAATALINYLKSDKTRKLIERYGYKLY